MPEIRPLTMRQLREKAMRLPLSSGVYLMKDRHGKIIYVGKAKALKNRVSQYFGSQPNHGIKVVRMVEHVADFDYILTDSEFEALVLECSLIKQYAPKYNILLKDDKGYSYIRVSNDGWPMISAVLQKADDGATYIGPYTSHFTVSNAVDEALKIYRLPRCGKTFPRDVGKGRPCLNYFIKQCSAPCAAKIGEQEYRETVEQALLFLKGGTADALRDLERRMTEAADNLEFEKVRKKKKAAFLCCGSARDGCARASFSSSIRRKTRQSAARSCCAVSIPWTEPFRRASRWTARWRMRS